ncbi:gamma-glutamyltranspeptidase domain-containing protein [Phthorimaea operculella]|nr:gamma-glutamyltranspeptidase domain-containing protein [Phthorimaea operculella]
MAPEGMVVTPHHLATQSALNILRDGGTAMEAAVSAAATLSVVYPHMNSIGGDGFWLIIPPHEEPFVIEACGAAGSLATPEFFKGLKQIPYQGPKSALTVAGTVGGWQEALDYVAECGYRKKSISKLLADAVKYAEEGFPVTDAQEANMKLYLESLQNYQEFSKVFLPDGKVPKTGEMLQQKNLAKSLKLLSDNGLSSFYRGELAKLIVEDMKAVGLPITGSDLANFFPERKKPLRLIHSEGELLNTPPPTQGIVSLAILGILDKLKIDGKNEGEFIHSVVEATKQAFIMRDKYVTDPRYMEVDPSMLISDKEILKMTRNIDANKAAPWQGNESSDTIWLGVMDNKGFSVSFIQSVYHKWGSGVVLPQTGILWHNRGTAFTLDGNSLLSLKPGKKPFHTLNPAAARLKDGRTMVYGTRGADGQSQIQAAIFHRYVIQGVPLQKSLSLPRWVFGRLAGDHESTLKLENRFSKDTLEYLKIRGHDVVLLPEFTDQAGHAGALVRYPNGVMEGAFDPRSNGSAAGF